LEALEIRIVFKDAAKTKNREDIRRQDILGLLEQAAG